MDIIKYVLLFAAVVAGVYVIVRVVSIAHFRTKSEFEQQKRVRDFLVKNGEPDAKR